MAPKNAAGCEDLRKWTLAEWNEALFRHFFTYPPNANPGPLLRLWVTAQELRLASGAASCSATEVRQLFITVLREAIDRRTLGLDAERRAIRWHCEDSALPPFLSHLIFTCMAANDVANDLKAVGDFRQRLSLMLRKESHGLERLLPLWEQLSEWLAIRNDAGGNCRPLRLPDIPVSGYHSIIGHSIRLAIPSRRDQERLSVLVRNLDLIGTEPDVNAVIRIIENNSGRFSSQFQDLFREFVSDLKSLPASALFHTSFWLAVRESISAQAVKRPDKPKDATGRLELEDDDGKFWLTLVADREIHSGGLQTIPLPAVRTSIYAFAVADTNGRSIVAQILSPKSSDNHSAALLAPFRALAATGI